MAPSTKGGNRGRAGSKEQQQQQQQEEEEEEGVAVSVPTYWQMLTARDSGPALGTLALLCPTWITYQGETRPSLQDTHCVYLSISVGQRLHGLGLWLSA